MRDSLKMALTLLVIGAVCGGLLSVVNAITQPIIEKRSIEDLREAMGDFFPEMDAVEEREIDGEMYYEIFDAGGDFIGVVGEVTASGYGDEPIRYNLAVDSDGEVVGLRIDSHTETPGIGDIIEKEDFQSDIIGLSFDDPIALDQDVDTVSGATVTMRGMVSSIRRVVDTIGMEFLGLEVEVVEIDPADVDDGTYTGTGSGFADDVTVEVTVSGGEITDIVVVEHNDTQSYFEQAEAEMPGRIIEAQSLEVDTVTDATASSEGIIEAVNDALN